MKRHFLAAVCAALVHVNASAQSTPPVGFAFIPEAGYTATPLFDSTAGFAITSLAVDASGDAYYLETDLNFTANSVLKKTTAASNYLSSTVLHTFTTPAYGSFIEVVGSRLIFGADNAISAINKDGSGFDALGNVVFNYDAEFSGGALYLSASPEGFGKNKIFRFTLEADGLGGQQLSAPDTILDTVSDNSGPLAFDSTGALLYGATKNALNGIFRYDAASVASAFGPTQLTLTPPANRIFANGPNQFFARLDDAHLFQLVSPFGSDPVVRRYDLTTGMSEPVAHGSAQIGEFFSGASATDDALFVAVARTNGNSIVYRVVPEPGSAALLALGIASLAARRRRL